MTSIGKNFSYNINHLFSSQLQSLDILKNISSFHRCLTVQNGTSYKLITQYLTSLCVAGKPGRRAHLRGIRQHEHVPARLSR